jgi:hypothetical protein
MNGESLQHVDASGHSTSGAAQSFRAAQIAAALGKTPQAVRRQLRDIRPDAARIVFGNEAATWTVDTLPAPMRKALATEAVRKNCKGDSLNQRVETLLSMPRQQWQPAIPMSQISDKDSQTATKQRAAQKPFLIEQRDPNLSAEEWKQRGVDNYQRVFGNRITLRYWDELLTRTQRRDNGREEWNRLEIYLPDRLKRKDEPSAVVSEELAADFAEIESFIAGCTNPLALNQTERAAVWSLALEKFTELVNAGTPEKTATGRVCQFLFARARFLSKSHDSLVRAFERKRSALKKSNGDVKALLDGRELKRGEKRAPEIPQSDVDQIVWHAAANSGGRVAQALRDFAERGEQSGLSAGTVEIITQPHSRKSQFNRRLTASVAGDVQAIMPYFQNKKVRDDATAHVERDYSKLVSMEIVNADDFTFPVYFYVPDGKDWFALTRGQCLLMLDVRSWKIIAWSLQPERNYNSLTIRTLMNRVCSGWGIPGTWYFEKGIWKKSHVVKGTAPNGWNDAHSWLESKIGWEMLGVKFKHAIRARTKPVERVGGLLQDLMHGVRGYCGRNEKTDCPEVTKRAMDDLKFHRVNHPGELFLSFDEWHARLSQLIDRYNAASQDGKVLQGMSPDEAFEKFWPHSKPPSRLGANSWHLVAHYVRPVHVTKNGICFRIGSKSFVYRNERTGQDRGNTVLAWFDPECPEFLCVTDMNRQNPYLVERSTPVDFLADPGDPVFEREIARAASHSAYPRARYNVLKARFAPTFRRDMVDVETAGTGQEFQRLRTDKITEQKMRQSQRGQAQRFAQRTGIAVPEREQGNFQADDARILVEFLNGKETK